MRYFHTKEFLEEQADKINMKYYPERLKEVIPLDPYDLLEKLGLDVEWKYISPNDSLLGMIFFEDGYWYMVAALSFFNKKFTFRTSFNFI